MAASPSAVFVLFDTTGWTEEQRASLLTNLSAQGEAFDESDDPAQNYPDARLLVATPINSQEG